LLGSIVVSTLVDYTATLAETLRGAGFESPSFR